MGIAFHKVMDGRTWYILLYVPFFKIGCDACAGKMYIQDKVEEYSDEVFDLLDKGVSPLHDHCSTVILLAGLLSSRRALQGLV